MVKVMLAERNRLMNQEMLTKPNAILGLCSSRNDIYGRYTIDDQLSSNLSNYDLPNPKSLSPLLPTPTQTDESSWHHPSICFEPT